MKKVLILTVTSGNGHNSAANSMKAKLESAGCTVKVVDILKEYGTKLSALIVDKGYALSVGRFLPFYNAFFNHYMKRTYKNAPVCPAQVSVNAVYGKMLQDIYEFQPDVIYGTSIHYAAMIIENLKRAYEIPAKSIVCMLDYVAAPFWEAGANGPDFLTIPHEDLRQPMMKKGYKNEKILCTGIPISEKFAIEIDKKEARRRLGLDENLPTVLIFYGGGWLHGGYEALKAILKRVKKKLQIAMINGKDEKTKQKIDSEMASYPDNFVVKNIGFCREVDLVMAACDCMIGKGGGLCTTESINRALPLIVTNKLPMQEVYNIKFLQNKGLAFLFKGAKDLARKIDFFLDNPNRFEEMSEGLKKLRLNGTDNIFKLIMEQPEADYSKIDKNIDYSQVNKVVKKARLAEYKRRKKEG